jgi:iron complex outermembrane recepter protein
MSRTFRSILLASVAVSFLPMASYAQSAPDGQAAGEETALEEIIVTGTRRADRTVADSPVPVDVLGAEALSNQGTTELNRALNTLVPSFNFPQPSITDGTDVIRPATLRGLAPDQTLVLVNGKRRHVTSLLNINGSVGRGSAAVDMNLIPTAAIKRIEVLRDGAAAQYGSDAIAGVINVVLKDASDGGSATASFSQYRTRLSGVPQITGVARDASGNPILTPDSPTASANHIFRLESNGEERKVNDGETWTLATNIGLPLGANGFFNFTAEYRDRNPTNRTGADPRRQYVALTGGAPDPREFTFDRYSHRYGDAATEDFNFFVNAGIELNEMVELYAFGSYGKRDGNSAGFYRRANDARNRNWSAIPANLQPVNGVAPVGATTAVINALPFTPFYADGFLPNIDTDLEDYSFAVGAKGEVASWNYDLSFVYGRNAFDFGVSNSFNTSLGATSPTTFDSGGLRFRQYAINADVQRTFEQVGFLDSLSVAFGLEYRNENYGIRQGDAASRANGPFSIPPYGAAGGAQVFGGFAVAVDEGRNNWSAYVDLDADVTDRWSIAVAGRYEDYSDFGSDWNGKLATRFEVSEQISLRGAVSTGFRAPSLHQQFFTSIATNNIGGVLVEAGTFGVDNPISRALGSVPLEPETSFSFSGGLVLQPMDNWKITADYYNIKINDRIVVTENLGASGSSPAAVNAAIGTFLRNQGINASAVRFFVNGLDSRTQGVDIISTYRLDLNEAGMLSLTAAYNYNKTTLSNIISTLGPLAQFPGVVLFGRQESLRLEQGQPRTKLVLSGDYDWNGLGISLKSTRYGEVFAPGVDAPPIPGGLGRNDIVLEPKWVTDLEVRYTLFDIVTLAVGANNLFDVYPTSLPTGVAPANVGGGNYSVNNYFLPYSSFSPFGFNGRQVYGRVSVKW